MRTMFHARVTGGTGAIAAQSGTAPNPFNPFIMPVVIARTGAGVYTYTFTGLGTFSLAQFKVMIGIEGGAGNANYQYNAATNVLTISTFVIAAATDENHWVCIEEIGDNTAS